MATLSLSHLALVEGLGLDLPLLLQAVNNVLVTPANLVGETLRRRAEFASDQPKHGDDKRTLTVQYFRPGFNRNTLRASGTTMRFLRS